MENISESISFPESLQRTVRLEEARLLLKDPLPVNITTKLEFFRHKT